MLDLGPQFPRAQEKSASVATWCGLTGVWHGRATVEHVHVNAGGQAIVGVVQPPKVNSKKSKETDAARAIAHAPGTALRCSDPKREPVPIAGGAGKTPL